MLVVMATEVQGQRSEQHHWPDLRLCVRVCACMCVTSGPGVTGFRVVGWSGDATLSKVQVFSGLVPKSPDLVLIWFSTVLGLVLICSHPDVGLLLVQSLSR